MARLQPLHGHSLEVGISDLQTSYIVTERYVGSGYVTARVEVKLESGQTFPFDYIWRRQAKLFRSLVGPKCMQDQLLKLLNETGF